MATMPADKRDLRLLDEPTTMIFRRRIHAAERMQKIVLWLLGGVIVISVAVWLITRERLPDPIRIATGSPGGQYYRFGEALAEVLEQRTEREVEVIETGGSVDNAGRLVAGDADLAILQGGAVPADGVAALVPLYPEIVHVIVRRASDISEINQLAGRRIAIGRAASGMRRASLDILNQYGIKVEDIDAKGAYFGRQRNDPSIEGAIVTTGLMNPDLSELLASGDYRILPLLDSEALSIHHPYFTTFEIPRGFFALNPLHPLFQPEADEGVI
jgi:TRAP transporter TAXI family solute receptor